MYYVVSSFQFGIFIKVITTPKPLDEDKFDYPEYEEVPISMVTALFQVVASTHSKKLAL